MKIFIAGVMQGNRTDALIQKQNYRQMITDILNKYVQDIDVVDPDKTDPDRLSYTHEQAAEMFFKYCNIAGEVDILIAYISEASMGSAIEMWKAYHGKVPIITISPLKHNWVVKLLSSELFASIELFEEALQKGTLNKYLLK